MFQEIYITVCAEHGHSSVPCYSLDMYYFGPADVHWSPRHKHQNEWSGDGTANGLEQIQLLSGQSEDSAVMTLTGWGKLYLYLYVLL